MPKITPSALRTMSLSTARQLDLSRPHRRCTATSEAVSTLVGPRDACISDAARPSSCPVPADTKRQAQACLWSRTRALPCAGAAREPSDRGREKRTEVQNHPSILPRSSRTPDRWVPCAAPASGGSRCERAEGSVCRMVLAGSAVARRKKSCLRGELSGVGIAVWQVHAGTVWESLAAHR